MRAVRRVSRQEANPSPIDFFTDTIATIGTAVVGVVIADGAPAVVGIAAAAGSGLVAGTDALVDLGIDIYNLTNNTGGNPGPNPAPDPTPRPWPIPAPLPDPGQGNPGPGGNGNRRVLTCEDLKPPGAVALNGGGWVNYLPSDAQGRNQGVNACLEGKPSSSRGEDATGNIRGWSDAQKRATALGFTPRSDIARCHSVPRMAGGTSDERNLTPCFQQGANINQRTGGRITNSMRTLERRVEKIMPQGPVLYDVLPQYTDDKSTIPNGWGMGYYGWDAHTGLRTGRDWTVVDNGKFGSGGYANLGN